MFSMLVHHSQHTSAPTITLWDKVYYTINTCSNHQSYIYYCQNHTTTDFYFWHVIFCFCSAILVLASLCVNICRINSGRRCLHLSPSFECSHCCKTGAFLPILSLFLGLYDTCLSDSG